MFVGALSCRYFVYICICNHNCKQFRVDDPRYVTRPFDNEEGDYGHANRAVSFTTSINQIRQQLFFGAGAYAVRNASAAAAAGGGGGGGVAAAGATTAAHHGNQFGGGTAGGSCGNGSGVGGMGAVHDCCRKMGSGIDDTSTSSSSSSMSSSECVAQACLEPPCDFSSSSSSETGCLGDAGLFAVYGGVTIPSFKARRPGGKAEDAMHAGSSGDVGILRDQQLSGHGGGETVRGVGVQQSTAAAAATATAAAAEGTVGATQYPGKQQQETVGRVGVLQPTGAAVAAAAGGTVGLTPYPSRQQQQQQLGSISEHSYHHVHHCYHHHQQQAVAAAVNGQSSSSSSSVVSGVYEAICIPEYTQQAGQAATNGSSSSNGVSEVYEGTGPGYTKSCSFDRTGPTSFQESLSGIRRLTKNLSLPAFEVQNTYPKVDPIKILRKWLDP